MYSAMPKLAIWLTLLWLVQPVWAAEGQSEQPSSQFLRLVRDDHRVPLALETPIVRCAPAGVRNDGPTVDLVAAIHIADKSYYQQLNREFENYDAVLYELVAPDEAAVPRPGDPESHHPVSLLQNGMKDLLALEFQLKGIDYTRANMVHADMSPDQFAEAMRQRGESPMTILVRMLGYALTQQGQSSEGASDGQLLLALFDRNRSLALKRVVAEQFAGSENCLQMLDGAGGSTLISGRNQVALKVLRRQIAAGKKKIAIFYGAAHMPDIQKRLSADFGMTPVSTRWLVAWNLKP
jgi:hypothetical protein